MQLQHICRWNAILNISGCNYRDWIFCNYFQIPSWKFRRKIKWIYQFRHSVSEKLQSTTIFKLLPIISWILILLIRSYYSLISVITFYILLGKLHDDYKYMLSVMIAIWSLSSSLMMALMFCCDGSKPRWWVLGSCTFPSPFSLLCGHERETESFLIKHNFILCLNPKLWLILAMNCLKQATL